MFIVLSSFNETDEQILTLSYFMKLLFAFLESFTVRILCSCARSNRDQSREIEPIPHAHHDLHLTL